MLLQEDLIGGDCMIVCEMIDVGVHDTSRGEEENNL